MCSCIDGSHPQPNFLCVGVFMDVDVHIDMDTDMDHSCIQRRGGGLGSRPKKMYGERLGDGVEYHLMKPTPRR